MLKLNKTLLLVFFLLTPTYLRLWSQTVDYSQIFGKDWEKAEEFVASNESWLRPALKRERLDYNTAIAVIFPELVRYSALRDKMEITLLKALYVNLGADYANFSIGNFQIKPSFAEQVCDYRFTGSVRRHGIKIPERSGFESDRDFRSAIVASLEDTRTEFNYIILFLKICESEFDLAPLNEEDKVVFLATAYNYGFNRVKEEIEKMTGKKFFTTRLISTEFYSYSDISLTWYNQATKKR